MKRFHLNLSWCNGGRHVNKPHAGMSGVQWMGVMIGVMLWLACVDDAAKERQPQHASQGELVIQAYLFENEKLTVKLDDSVYYVRTRNPNNMAKFVDRVPLPPHRITSVHVETMQKGQKYLDTTFVLNEYDPEGVLRIAITVPFPFDHQKYTDTVPYRSWGVLPIDSCIRFVTWQRW
jgi:hypothetical protein